MASQTFKVWPTNSFLSHSVAPKLSPSHLTKCRNWFAQCLTRSNHNQNFNSRQSSASRNRHGYNRREFISTVSDVFCITGGITAITGTLVASFGIFPRNQIALCATIGQASIRLYLEFIGCSMVIVGVLILFASLKLKPSSQVMDASDELIFFSPATATARTSNFDFRRHRINRHNSASAVESINLRAPATVVQRQVTACSEIQRMVEHESNKCNSCDGSSLHSSSWIPKDAYGDDHQAAIEAALSTVLAVSTLVGFRAQQTSSDDQECCLHHTIQHTIKAKKWIRMFRLGRDCGRVAPATVGGRCDPLMLLQRNASGSNNQPRENSQDITETKDRIQEEAETSFCV